MSIQTALRRVWVVFVLFLLSANALGQMPDVQRKQQIRQRIEERILERYAGKLPQQEINWMIRRELEIDSLCQERMQASERQWRAEMQKTLPVAANNQAGAVLEQDSLALVALYNSTNGPGWTNNTNWLTGPVSSWYGVYVWDGRIVSLSLRENNLTGSIPAELGNLGNLQNLGLEVNQLSGSIPATLGNLTNMDALYLASNQLSGSIPAELGNLLNLQRLNLSGNSLSGSIPVELGNLTNLQGLYLYLNQLSGSIPAALGNLTNLQGLYLHSNQLTGSIPAELGNLTNLQSLYLHSNQLTGSVPTALGNLTNLQSLYLHSNQLTGSVPTALGNLTNLQGLYLDQNQLSGLPDLSVLASHVTSFRAQTNQFTFEDIEPNIGIPGFSYSPQADVLFAKDTTINRASYLTFTALVGGTANQYQWYKDGGLIPGATGAEYVIPFVRSSDAGVYTCSITNTIATALTLRRRPITVRVKSATVTEQDSLALVALYNSTNGPAWGCNQGWLAGPVAYWHGVRVSGGRVIAINLSRNDLSGNIPLELGSLTNLELLDLFCNQLRGAIPSTLGNLSVLLRFNLSDNSLIGSIPVELGNLTNLEELYLNYNQLNGAMPTELNNLVNLKGLYLFDNRLTRVPDLSALALHLLDFEVSTNCLTFEDIEPNVGIPGFRYSPQADVLTVIDTTVAVGAGLSFTALVGGTANQYQWYKDGSLIPGAVNSQFTINAVALADSGVYTCDITNTIATALTLHRRPVTVHVTAGAPNINVSSRLLSFGDVNLGGSADLPLTVTNGGAAFLNITSTQLSGAGDFSIAGGGGGVALAPGASKQMVLRFRPTVYGPRQARLYILSNDPDTDTLTVNLYGNLTAHRQLTLSVDKEWRGHTSPSVGSHWYPPGEAVTITAIPGEAFNTIYRFKSWTGDVSDSLSAVTTVTMDASKEVRANFTSADFHLTVSVEPSGTGSVEITPNQETYESYERIFLKAVPRGSNVLSHWATGSEVLSNQDTMSLFLRQDTVVTAVFQVINPQPPRLSHAFPIKEAIGVARNAPFVWRIQGDPYGYPLEPQTMSLSIDDSLLINGGDIACQSPVDWVKWGGARR